MEIILPKPTAYQKEVIEFLKDGYNSGKTACVKSVRQSGKSFMSMLILIMYALGRNVGQYMLRLHYSNQR